MFGLLGRRPHAGKGRRGQSMVEFAICIPVFLLFVFGIFQVALLYQANAALGQAASDAAHALAAQSTSGAQDAAYPNNWQADGPGLRSIRAALTSLNLNDVAEIDVYEADQNGQPVTPSPPISASNYLTAGSPAQSITLFNKYVVASPVLTTGIAYNATATQVAKALNALTNVAAAGGVTATGGPLPGTNVTVTYAQNGAQPAITGDFTGLIPSTTGTVTQISPGTTTTKASDIVSYTGATGGAFTLTANGPSCPVDQFWLANPLGASPSSNSVWVDPLAPIGPPDQRGCVLPWNADQYHYSTNQNGRNDQRCSESRLYVKIIYSYKSLFYPLLPSITLIAHDVTTLEPRMFNDIDNQPPQSGTTCVPS